MGSITIEELQKVSYLDTRYLEDRTVKLMPLWTGSDWKMWLDTSDGLVIETRIVDVGEGDYIAQTAARESDLYIPFVHLMWQCASWTEICPLILAISDDFHNMAHQ
jgi:hypothetical protein